MVPSAASAVMDRVTAQSCVPVWVVPAECCAGGKVSDPRPSPVANTCFEQRVDPVSDQKDLIKVWGARLQVTTDIKAGEDVTVPYGCRYPPQLSTGGPAAAV